MSVCVKTHDLELVADARTDGNNMLPGIVRSQAYLGSHRDYIVDVGQEVLIAAPASINIQPGSKVKVCFRAERCRGIIR
jgi:iron(III) transport system ATP-binding protein